MPIEGYYDEDEDLAEYFLLTRALQEVKPDRAPVVATLAEFQRLYRIGAAPLAPAGVDDRPISG